jgi:hypothetical protein
LPLYGKVREATLDRVAFTVTQIWSSSIYVRSIATRNVFDVSYTSPIAAETGDTVTVLMDSNNNWKTIINERTGKAATVNNVRRV